MDALTNDELQTHIRDGIVELERRLTAAGKPRLLRRAKTVHAILEDIEESLFGDGEVSARSGGTGPDKPPAP